MVQLSTLAFLALSVFSPLTRTSPVDPPAPGITAEAAAPARPTTICTTFSSLVTITESRERTQTRTSTYLVVYPVTTYATNTSTTIIVTTRTREPQTETKTALVSNCIIATRLPGM